MFGLVDLISRNHRDHGHPKRQNQRHVIGAHEPERFLANILDIGSGWQSGERQKSLGGHDPDASHRLLDK